MKNKKSTLLEQNTKNTSRIVPIKKSGQRTPEGEARRIASLYIHGNRSKSVIDRRKLAYEELKVLRQIAYSINLIPWWGDPRKKPKLQVLKSR